MRSFFGSLAAMLWKDLLVESRSREVLSMMLVFALLVIVIFNFALDVNPDARVDAAAGVLWVALAFAGSLGMNRSLAGEKDRGSLDGLLLAPVDHLAIFCAKALGNLIMILLVSAVILPVYSLFYGVNLFNLGLICVVFLGSLGYAAAGTLLGCMAVQARTRDVLLPILLFPVSFPLLLSAIHASAACLQPNISGGIGGWMGILAAYDLVVIAAAVFMFDAVLEE